MQSAPLRRVIVVIDLAGYAKAFQTRDDAEMAGLLDEYYRWCEQVLVHELGIDG